MMNKLVALTALSAMTASAAITPETRENLATIQRDGISAESSFGRHLLSKARRVEQAQQDVEDISFVSNYSLKFMGCHHVTQWASEEELEEEDYEQDEEAVIDASNGRIKKKGIVRFRLCPSNTCFDNFGAGCSANYGEYMVSLTLFVEAYYAYQAENAAYQCATYQNICYQDCYQSNNANCYTKCYRKYGVNVAFCSNNGENQYNEYDSYGNVFQLEDYLECGEYPIENGDGEEIVHYLGPYCDKQGGDIKLGFFQDQYCGIPSEYQAQFFEKQTGVSIPYTSQSLVSTNCMSCESTEQEAEAQNQQDYYNYDQNGQRNYYVAKQVNEFCGDMYMQSGKCETQFNQEDVPYPDESACTYIESVKRLKDDGIIRADQKVSSKPASVAIGLFTGLAVLLGGYVYYLKSKISRSRINLAGATTHLA